MTTLSHKLTLGLQMCWSYPRSSKKTSQSSGAAEAALHCSRAAGAALEGSGTAGTALGLLGLLYGCWRCSGLLWGCCGCSGAAQDTEDALNLLCGCSGAALGPPAGPERPLSKAPPEQLHTRGQPAILALKCDHPFSVLFGSKPQSKNNESIRKK